jgi:hypothetical protein
VFETNSPITVNIIAPTSEKKFELATVRVPSLRWRFYFLEKMSCARLKWTEMFLVSVLIFAVSLAVSPSAFAWFFVIPGSVTRSISDAITGEEGFHCVGRDAKVGDVIQTSTGPGIVKSL